MRALIVLVCFSLGVLSGCGGGGGGGAAAPPAIYQGKTTPAVVTTQSAEQFFSFYNTGIITEAPSEGAIPKALTRSAMNLIAKAHLKTAAATPVSGSLMGASGSATYAGSINDNGTGTVTFTYSSFDMGDGDIYNGQMIVRVDAFDMSYGIPTVMLVTLSHLSVASGQQLYTVQGTIGLSFDMAARMETVTMNLDGRLSQDGEWFRLENLVQQETYDNIVTPTTCAETVNGRIYLGSLGYVDVIVNTPLRYDYYNWFNVNVPNTGGPIILKGLNSRARITPLSVTQFKTEVDATDDGIYEDSTTYLWSGEVGIVYNWTSAVGSPTTFEAIWDAQPTSDGGVIAGGFKNTNTANLTDFYLARTDGAGGETWTRTFGGADQDQAAAVLETADHGFIIAGTSTVSGIAADGQYKKGYMVKTDANGNASWQRTLSARPDNVINSVRQTADGGYILTGSIYSQVVGGSLVGYGLEDLYLVKLDASGNVLWEARFGGPGSEVGRSVRETSSGGFIIAGSTVPLSAANEQAYLVMADASGNLIWEKELGDMYSQVAFDAQPLADGGVVALVSSNSATGWDYQLVRYSADGTLTWTKTFAGGKIYPAIPQLAAIGGGYAVLGKESMGYNCYRLTGDGDPVSSFSVTRPATDTIHSFAAALDGGYVLGGTRDVVTLYPPQSDWQALIVKTTETGAAP